MTDIRIVADHLGKQFRHRGLQHPRRWRDVLRSSWRRVAEEPFWALRDVSFTVHAGEMLGVIGSNGAGKSTLLCLLSGLSDPSVGRASVSGRIGALLELGGGFVDDLTGRENAIMAGVVAGLTRAEVLARFDEIAQFADIAGFLDEPVRTYSTGMRMRLAFAVAIHTNPDVLLVDEFLSVGDLAFQSKCRSRIAELQAGGCAIVVVSHALDDVRSTCDRVLWLRGGMVAALDTPEVVTELYQSEMHQRTLERTPLRVRAGARKPNRDSSRTGSGEIEITHVGLSASSLQSGDSLAVSLEFQSRQSVRAPIFGVSITRSDGTVCLDTNTEGARVSTENLSSSGTIRFSIPRLELSAGRYFVNVGIFQSEWSHAYDYHWHMYPFSMDGASMHQGIVAPPCQWEAQPATGGARPPAAAEQVAS